MKRGKLVLILFPAVVGILLNLFLKLILKENLVVYLKADIAILVLFMGILGSAAFGVAEYVSYRESKNKAWMAARARDDRIRMLRRLDHELKNPLTAIRAGLANLAEPLPDASRIDTLMSLEAQTLRLSRLSANLRKLAELEDRLIERSVIQVPGLLQDAFTMAQELPGAGERVLKIRVPGSSTSFPNIIGDPDLLLLAVHNLLDNAVKFTRPGDSIELCAYQEGSSVIIEVTDTGPGIPEEEQAHVWEELYRGKAGRGVPGSGLGLSLVHAIMERHYGQVSLKSHSGLGTSFNLLFPIRKDLPVTNL